MESSSSPVTPQLLSSSSSPPPPPPPPPPRLSLQSPELQAEFLKERRNKFRSQVDSSDSMVSSVSSPPSSPFTQTPSSPLSPSASSPHPDRPARLSSLSSPELLSELKDSRTRPLRHVPAHNGLTTVFSGRGRGQVSDSAPTIKPANQRMSR
ncbi:pectinesterase inhibitor 10-like isoform X2 [Mugil cephalus]|uniref:pectinesterase inhibitor 10-like isoform X2 n=1 Tax=Mugil cephalus TaxID=48193 RepID=UPI001FB6E907|nr:pectinesterase inhibitor 10-like isoform X2 [Mugil cephalus]